MTDVTRTLKFRVRASGLLTSSINSGVASDLRWRHIHMIAVSAALTSALQLEVVPRTSDRKFKFCLLH